MSLLAGCLLVALGASYVPAAATGERGSKPPAELDPERDLVVEATDPPAALDVQERDRASQLGADWRTSGDKLWTVHGDEHGLHLLIASADEGYRWETAATLSEPGLDADSWVGNACLTASADRAVVVYAPRTFTNDPVLFDRGAFSAVVDLRSGDVTKLGVGSTLAYFNPGCGASETAVLTQAGHEDLGRTRLMKVDTVSAAVEVDAATEVPGQLTSAVPVGDGIVAAEAGALVAVAPDGGRSVLTTTQGVPFAVTPDAGGGIVFLERRGSDQVEARRAVPRPSAGARVASLASGALTELDVTAGRGGQVAVVGTPKTRHRSPDRSVQLVDVPVGSQLSTQGRAAVTDVDRASGGVMPQVQAEPSGATATEPTRLSIVVKSLTTKKTMTLRADAVPTEAGVEGEVAVNGATEPQVGVSGSASDPGDLDKRTCSVPRNDPRNQAMQPRPRQVEWAVDQAVRGALTVRRPSNWKNLGMPAYTPQGLFPSIPLEGGGHVPAQIMLGIAAQESNLWQASRYTVPGVTGNPLIGNYYGIDYYDNDPDDDWTIDWGEADCGYGVTQVTDGMRLAGHGRDKEVLLPYQTQRAVALDFAANVAAGLQILQKKWNETTRAGLVVNNGDPSKIENWFMAVWAYNSGFYPERTASKNDGAWGVGWSNNPVNPKYPANRSAFLDRSYSDAAHPQDWPYPEKVLGWAGHPVEVLDAPNQPISGFRPAWWPGGGQHGPVNRTNVKPPVDLFCDATNQCTPGAERVPTAPDVIGSPAGPCGHRNAAGQIDLKCWYNQPVVWKENCPATCGNELLRFDPGYEYQPDGTAYPPRCTLDGLPAGALIVDDVPDGVPSVRPGCGRPWANQGDFSFSYLTDGTGNQPGKIDTHQIGGGFGGHFWFTHTRAPEAPGRLRVEGQWRLNRAHHGPMRVMVALPDHGARTLHATYTVMTASGEQKRTLPQKGEGTRWVSLGAFMFDDVPEVRLLSTAPRGDGSVTMAFDAVAFVPISGRYIREEIEAVGVFDEDQDIDTAMPSWLAGPLSGRRALFDWAVARSSAILALPPCPAAAGEDCLDPEIESSVRDWRDEVWRAGFDPVNHPDGSSIARWIGFANSAADRPTSGSRPAHFDDDGRYKIKTKATVSFVADENGKVIPGSEWAEYTHRTGDTHLPPFLVDLFSTVEKAYGIARPDLRYEASDMNVHDGRVTVVDGRHTIPGRAYASAGKAPVLTDATGHPTSDASCVAALTVAGGSIGYRPMLAAERPAQEVDRWVRELDSTRGVPKAVVALAEDVRGMFFNTGSVPVVNASLFTQAPPIWHELNFLACADGYVRPIAGGTIVRSSLMPDTYLYRNGFGAGMNGEVTVGTSPVSRGDFGAFSRLSEPNEEHPLWANPFGDCDSSTGASGNPWGFTMKLPLQPPGRNPDSAHFCVDRSVTPDASHSSR